VAAYASYQHQRDFALHDGADPASAALWPLSVDGLLLLATVGLPKSSHLNLQPRRPLTQVIRVLPGRRHDAEYSGCSMSPSTQGGTPGLGALAPGMPESANRAKEIMMAGLLNRIKNFMRSPRGQQMTNKARDMAKDPRNRERARQAAQKLRRKR
jgi:hypothetical protein